VSDLFPIGLDDEIAEVQRELDLRAVVYPHWVRSRRLKQEKADRQIAVLRAVLSRLRALAAEGRK
jgi:hypothetical protein